MSSDTSQRRIVNASLLRAVIDQFAERATHPIGDIEQFEKLALGLIEIVDAEIVANLARPLCFNPETPPAIFAQLYDKGGPCARLAFEYAPTLPRADLLATAEHGPADFALAVARRRDLDRDVVAALASRSERAILRALAANRAAHLDAAARRALTLAARDDIPLARLLLDRDDLEIDPEPLFLAATRLERMAIVLNACRRALAGGRIEKRPADPAFVERLEEAALRRNRDAMAGLLADALDCRKDRARAILLDSLGEAQALTYAALGVHVDAATRLLICADPSISHDADRVRSLRALMRSTPQRAAMRIVCAIAGIARADKDPARRTGFREDALAGPGWRRAASHAAGPESRKLDQSA
jgi:uncharacterized protein (DUF2336 family)